MKVQNKKSKIKISNKDIDKFKMGYERCECCQTSVMDRTCDNECNECHEYICESCRCWHKCNGGVWFSYTDAMDQLFATKTNLDKSLKEYREAIIKNHDSSLMTEVNALRNENKKLKDEIASMKDKIKKSKKLLE